MYNHDEPLECDAIVWTAGIQANEVVRNLPVEQDGSGRVVLTKYHNIPNNEHVYVVGDCAALPHAPSAQLAEGQGEQIVQILLKRWHNEPLPDELPVIKLKGVLGSLGKAWLWFASKPTINRTCTKVTKIGILWMYKYHNG